MSAHKKYCPDCEKEMKLTEMEESMVFRNVEITYKDHAYICPDCGMDVSTHKQMAETQRAMSDAYRKKAGLLTGEEIRNRRKKFGLSQKALADKMTVGIASIKRWEGGIIQSKSMDKALRNAFWNNKLKNDYTGSREFLISRVKLVAKYFESLLDKRLLLKN